MAQSKNHHDIYRAAGHWQRLALAHLAHYSPAATPLSLLQSSAKTTRKIHSSRLLSGLVLWRSTPLASNLARPTKKYTKKCASTLAALPTQLVVRTSSMLPSLQATLRQIAPAPRKMARPNTITPTTKSKKIAEEYREQLDVQDGEHSLMLMAVNTAGVENDVLGLAFQSTDEDKAKGGNGPMVLVLSNKTGGNVYSHEIGHVLSRDEKNGDPSKEKQFGKGMGHEMVMDCLITDAEGNITQYCAVDTIQQLLTMGCGLSKRDKSDAVNEYASPVTVMGNSTVYTDADTKVSQITNEVTATEEHKPIYSPAELTFLDSRHQVECTTSTDGRYPLSYDFTKRFALAYSLPNDHALKTILPKADTLIFAPIIEYIDKDTPFDSTDLDAVQRRIGVFATWDNGRGTALLDVSLFNTIDYSGEKENVIYADEQLGFVAVSGYDKTDGEYVRIVNLSSQEGTALLDEARTRTAERNQLLLKPKQANEP